MPMEQQFFSFVKKTAYAVLSEDRVSRYVLYRSLDGEDWNAELSPLLVPRRTVCFVMLNPSKADEYANDPTIDKLTKYGKLWGFQCLSVVNLFAYRETDSKRLRSLSSARDIVGPDNDPWIIKTALHAQKIVCGWGNEGEILGRGEAVRALLSGFRLWCFKRNQNGTPCHPLYQRDDAELVEYR